MTFSTDTLRTLINDQNGLASNNRFRVIFPDISGTPKPGGGTAKVDADSPRALNSLCTSARFPGKNFNLLERGIGMEQLKIVNGFTFTEVAFTFYLTNNYSARKYFQEWTETIASPTPPYSAGFHNNYAKSISVTQLDKLGEPVYVAEMTKAYPTSISEIELNNQAQSAALELTVSMTYANFLIK
jgi:hypothetical protein